MKSRAGTQDIPVADLRVGMYVHLDLGWMSHPFALSHFRLTGPEQIETLRGLGLKTVRWNPALSELPAAAAAEAGPVAGAVQAVPGAPVEETAAAGPTPAGAPSSTRAIAPASAAATPPLPAAVAGDAGAEHDALVVCERQFQEAAGELRRVHDDVIDHPERARDGAVALSGALLQKMAGRQELCIRVLGENLGDRHSAHALNVALLSMLMGRAFGWSDEELLNLGVGALMHDIGKLELPERLRHRDEQFTAAEMRYYEEHVARGVARARRMGLPAAALLVIGQHHEMADRSGFPLKIGSDRMTAAARVVALVNRYDRLCNPVRAHLSLTPHEAISLLFAQCQAKFDTSVLGAFVKMMGVYPPGSVVQLTDDRLAIVVSVNSSRPLKPRVQVFRPDAPAGEPALQPLNLEATPGLGIRRSLKPAALPKPALQALAPRQRVAYFFEPVVREATPAEPPEALAA
ncbi:HD-GYP domain-containing protein [Piscinibacter sakaiensis]|nr:HD-GYP domain-containing protein [Piscinibacter sakaiensis]